MSFIRVSLLAALLVSLTAIASAQTPKTESQSPTAASSDTDEKAAEKKDDEWWKHNGHPKGKWWLTYDAYEGAAADEIWKTVPIPPSPVLSPEEALESFVLDENFKIEIVAAEPLIVRPVFHRFDAAGRLWVVEMPGYMRDIDGSDESDPSGRVSVLEDTDGDGRMDKSTVFLDGLVMPRSLAIVPGGALVVEPPNIWYARDVDGDLVADEMTLVAENYGEYGNPEHSANGLVPAIDNWMYSAKSAVRFQFRHGKLNAEPTAFRGQWGISQDNAGRLYYNYNASPLHTDLAPTDYFVSGDGVDLSQRSQVRGNLLNNVDLAADKSLMPARVTPLVTLGASDLRPDGTLKKFSAASSPLIYRAALFPAGYENSVFICDPVGNLVKRYAMHGDGLDRHVEPVGSGPEFLASTDERFRPVFVETGPDGALYVADMYTGIIEHKKYVTEYLRNQVLSRGLGNFLDTGRIYRITPRHTSRPAFGRLDQASPRKRVEAFSSDNGWVRDTAQRLLVDAQDKSVAPLLRKVVRSSPNALARLHALWTLSGLDALDESTVVVALADKDPQMKIAAMRLAEPLAAFSAPTLVAAYTRLAKDKNSEVRLQLVLSAGRLATRWADQLVREQLAAHDDEWLPLAVAAGLRDREADFIRSVLVDASWESSQPIRQILLEQLGVMLMAERDPAAITAVLSGFDERKLSDWRVAHVLKGMGAMKVAGEPLFLPTEPKILRALQASKGEAMVKAYDVLAAGLTWPHDTRARADAVAKLTVTEQALFDIGATQYAAICAACHQANGQGLTGVAPPLAGSEWVTGDVQIPTAIVLQGLIGLVTVQGQDWNMVMPGLGAVPGLLNDSKLAGIVTYIRRSWGNEGSAVTVAEMAEVRAKLADRKQPWTAKELKELASEPTASNDLGSALRLHVTFDEGIEADYAAGDPRLYQFSSREERLAGGSPIEVPLAGVEIDSERGKFGGALRLTAENEKRLFYRSDQIIDHSAAEFSGTVSVWLQTTPDEDLPKAFVDPVMFISENHHAGFLFIEWSRDHEPKRFRYTIWPETTRWNPNKTDWESIPDDERPMIQLDYQPFSRDRWVHVAFTYDRINAGELGSGSLFIDGVKQGTIEGWDMTFAWDPAHVIIALGWSYVGGIDDLAIFDRALSAAEIHQIRDAPQGLKSLLRPNDTPPSSPPPTP